MKRIWIFLLILCLIIPASASASLVIDNAGLLTGDQINALNQQLEGIRSAVGIDVVVLTENTIDGASPMKYADDYYDYNGYGSDGVLLLLDMDQRQWWISTCGSCMQSLDADAIGEQFVSYLSDGAYYEGFSVFAKLVRASMEQPGEYYVNDDLQIVPKVTPWHKGLGQGLIVGIVVGGIAVAIMAAGMRNVKPKHSASDYINTGGVQITCQEDRFLYQTVTKQARPKSSSGGAHSGSSGRSHGGGGGRF